jgi:hypothetical protein
MHRTANRLIHVLAASCFVALGCAVTPAAPAPTGEFEEGIAINNGNTTATLGGITGGIGTINFCPVPMPTCPSGTQFVKYLVQLKSIQPAADGKKYCPLVGRTQWYPSESNCFTHDPAGNDAVSSARGGARLIDGDPICTYEWHGDDDKLAASKNDICKLDFDQVIVVCTSAHPPASCNAVHSGLSQDDPIWNLNFLDEPDPTVVAGDTTKPRDMQGGCPNCVHVEIPAN